MKKKITPELKSDFGTNTKLFPIVNPYFENVYCIKFYDHHLEAYEIRDLLFQPTKTTISIYLTDAGEGGPTLQFREFLTKIELLYPHILVLVERLLVIEYQKREPDFRINEFTDEFIPVFLIFSKARGTGRQWEMNFKSVKNADCISVYFSDVTPYNVEINEDKQEVGPVEEIFKKFNLHEPATDHDPYYEATYNFPPTKKTIVILMEDERRKHWPSAQDMEFIKKVEANFTEIIERMKPVISKEYKRRKLHSEIGNFMEEFSIDAIELPPFYESPQTWSISFEATHNPYLTIITFSDFNPVDIEIFD
jgi:hypothetical protein